MKRIMLFIIIVQIGQTLCADFSLKDCVAPMVGLAGGALVSWGLDTNSDLQKPSVLVSLLAGAGVSAGSLVPYVVVSKLSTNKYVQLLVSLLVGLPISLCIGMKVYNFYPLDLGCGGDLDEQKRLKKAQGKLIAYRGLFCSLIGLGLAHAVNYYQ